MSPRCVASSCVPHPFPAVKAESYKFIRIYMYYTHTHTHPKGSSSNTISMTITDDDDGFPRDENDDGVCVWFRSSKVAKSKSNGEKLSPRSAKRFQVLCVGSSSHALRAELFVANLMMSLMG